MRIPNEIYSQMLAVLPILCVDVLMMHEGKCLLLLRDNEPAKGHYWFPGGRVYKNEFLREAVIRKAKEETGLECQFQKIISIEETLFPKEGAMAADVHTVNVCCLASVKSVENLKPDALHAAALWTNKIDPSWHEGVKNPLRLIGFN